MCTSVASSGVWYVYQRERHRWSFDPEGAEVLVWCLRILSEQVDSLRRELLSAPMRGQPPPRGGPGVRVPFPRLANFPDEGAHSAEDIQKAILVHLDTIIGDVRHMQSVVRYLGKLLMPARVLTTHGGAAEPLVCRTARYAIRASAALR